MRILSKTASGSTNIRKTLEKSEKLSIYYHDLFDYPLTFSDLIKWNVSKTFISENDELSISYQNNFYFLKGREGLIYKRVLRERISVKKMEIAKRASRALSIIPTILMVGVTGSLAMNNAVDGSDIDLMIITKKGTLWTTRLLSYFLLCTLRYALRRPFDKVQKGKLCLNMWMDETDIVWKNRDRNIYTAHEIAQVLPLVNKNKSYEKFISKNKWIQNFWPNSVRISSKNQVAGSRQTKKVMIRDTFHLLRSLVEKIAYKFQYLYMKNKISREVVTPTRAIFHPKDLSKIVVSHLDS